MDLFIETLYIEDEKINDEYYLDDFLEEKPINKYVKEKPINKDVKEKPINKYVKEKPINKDVKEKPINKDVKEKPINKYVKERKNKNVKEKINIFYYSLFMLKNNINTFSELYF